MRKPAYTAIGIGLAASGLSRTAAACSVCFGDPSSSQTQGMNMAIFTMLGVVALVFAGIAVFVLRLRRRVAALAAAETYGVEAAPERCGPFAAESTLA